MLVSGTAADWVARALNGRYEEAVSASCRGTGAWICHGSYRTLELMACLAVSLCCVYFPSLDVPFSTALLLLFSSLGKFVTRSLHVAHQRCCCPIMALSSLH